MPTVLCMNNEHKAAITISSTDDAVRALHVVLGAGQIGVRLATGLRERGHRVRIVQRGTSAAGLKDIEHRSGDITDVAFAMDVGVGASVVYDCMNPAYHQWSTQLLPLGNGSLHAATTSGAKLVALDCLYMYGRPVGPMREDHVIAPCSKKGALRERLADLRLEAHRRGDVRLAIGRASDFFGPNLPMSCFSDRFFERLFAGSAGECWGDPDMPHSYTFADDVADALITLGAHDDTSAIAPVWHLPTAPAESTRALVARLGAAMNLTATTTRMSPLLMTIGGVFMPVLRELKEMTYEWEVPFVLDDSRFTSTFGQRATPTDVAVARVAAWAKDRFGRAASRAA